MLNKKIKILYLLTRVNIGGPAMHVALITSKLDKQKFDSYVACGQLDKDEGDMSYVFAKQNIDLIKIPGLVRPISLFNDLVALFSILRLLFVIQPDILDTHMAKSGCIGRLSATIYNLINTILVRPHRIKKLHTFHGHIFEAYFSAFKTRLFLFIERFLANHTETLFVISKTQKDDLLNKYKIGIQKQYQKINLGLDFNYLENTYPDENIEQCFSNFKDKLKIGFIGRLVEVKDPLFLITLLKELNDNIKEQIHFFVAGDGNLKDELLNKIKENKLTEYITYIPWVKDLKTLYSNLDCVYLFSLNEGTPIVILEAFYFNLFVASTPVGGVVDLLSTSHKLNIIDGDFLKVDRGYLVKNYDVNAWTAVTLHLIKEKKNKNLALKEFVINNYSIETLVKNMENCYNYWVGRDVSTPH
ncbi:MAG: glycosyltransferase [Candidatus Hydrogenedentota bacterium]